MNKYILIKLKDSCYYDDDFTYPIYIIKRDKQFDDKYNKLLEICENYEDFDEIETYIKENFKTIDYEEKIIEI